jgi:hypothetical protein
MARPHPVQHPRRISTGNRASIHLDGDRPMTMTHKLIAAALLAASFAAPVFSANAAVDGLALTLAERNTYTNPAQGAGWSAAYAMDARHKMGAKHKAAMNADWPAGRTDTNVSPASMDSGLRQLK